MKIWSNHGCKTTLDYADGGDDSFQIVRCLCDHLTSFAILMVKDTTLKTEIYLLLTYCLCIISYSIFVSIECTGSQTQIIDIKASTYYLSQSFESESIMGEELMTQILLTASLIGLSLTLLTHLPNR